MSDQQLISGQAPWLHGDKATTSVDGGDDALTKDALQGQALEMWPKLVVGTVPTKRRTGERQRRRFLRRWTVAKENQPLRGQPLFYPEVEVEII